LAALPAFAPGLYPRSEALVQATRDLDRGRTTEAAVAEQAERDFHELIAVQEAAALDLLSDGMLRWQDLFRPLAEASDGIEARPLTRFLDTNTFYRALLVEGEARLRSPLPPPDLRSGRWLATLPSPYAFSRAADGRASAQALAANVLAPQIEAWSEAGCALVVLSEPFLARAGDVAEAVAALSELPTDVPLALQLVFGDASAILDGLADAPVAAVGVDFYLTPIAAVPEEYPRELLAGVVDARSSALEEPAEIASFVEQLADRSPAGISLVPNGDLQFVSETIAREKLVRLGRARVALQEAVTA
jgi:5-methyltetrahydropteroyltriglutamate--homocysteine methyltransferase